MAGTVEVWGAARTAKHTDDNNMWPPLSCRSSGSLVSLYDLLSAADVGNPRSRWSRIAGRRPDLAQLVSSVTLPGTRQPTPMVDEETWTMVLAAHLSSTNAPSVAPVEGATLETEPSVAPATLTLHDDNITALMEVVEGLREERDGLLFLLDRLDDDAVILDEDEARADLFSDEERAWWRQAHQRADVVTSRFAVSTAPVLMVAGPSNVTRSTGISLMGADGVRALGKANDIARAARMKAEREEKRRARRQARKPVLVLRPLAIDTDEARAHDRSIHIDFTKVRPLFVARRHQNNSPKGHPLWTANRKARELRDAHALLSKAAGANS